ncbi:MAG: hypothetical protein HY927_16545 [Elusimicrobia bacterium]|nr:hypothetical protein [Elusimicrobiota bacterium]
MASSDRVVFVLIGTMLLGAAGTSGVQAGAPPAPARAAAPAPAPQEEAAAEGDEAPPEDEAAPEEASPKQKGGRKGKGGDPLKSRLAEISKAHKTQMAFGAEELDVWTKFWTGLRNQRGLFEQRMLNERKAFVESLSSLDAKDRSQSLLDFERMQNNKMRSFEDTQSTKIKEFILDHATKLREFGLAQEENREKLAQASADAWTEERSALNIQAPIVETKADRKAREKEKAKDENVWRPTPAQAEERLKELKSAFHGKDDDDVIKDKIERAKKPKKPGWAEKSYWSEGDRGKTYTFGVGSIVGMSPATGLVMVENSAKANLLKAEGQTKGTMKGAVTIDWYYEKDSRTLYALMVHLR